MHKITARVRYKLGSLKIDNNPPVLDKSDKFVQSLCAVFKSHQIRMLPDNVDISTKGSYLYIRALAKQSKLRLSDLNTLGTRLTAIFRASRVMLSFIAIGNRVHIKYTFTVPKKQRGLK